MRPPPTTVIILASINLTIELICGLVCNPSVLLMLTIPSPMQTTILEDGYRGNMVYYGCTLVLLLMALAGTFVSIVGNIAMLNMRDRGRRIVLGYAVFSILLAVCTLTVSAVFDGGALVSGGLPAQKRSELVLGLVVNSGCVLVFGMLYPALQLYLLTRREVVDAFLRPPAAANEPMLGEAGWAAQPPTPWDGMPPGGYPPQVPPPPSYPPPPDNRDQ